MNLGMDIEPSWSLVRLIVPLEEVELVVDDLLTRGAAAVEEIDSGEGLVVLRTSLGGGAGDSLVGLVERFPGISIVEEQVPRSVADTWRDHASVTPVDDGLVLVPAWLRPPSTDAVSVLVEPFDTFGLGNHPTTVAALRLARRVVPRGSRLHDHGTGSGVIAVAMGLTHACRLSADDIHPGSRRALRHNCEANGVAEPAWHDGLPQEKVDAVVANILAPVLRDHASGISDVLDPGGWVILSGMRVDQFDGVVERYTDFDVVDTEIIDGWIAAALSKR